MRADLCEILRRHPAVLLFGLTFFVHLVVMLLLHYLGWHPFGGGRDDLEHHRAAVAVAKSLSGDFWGTVASTEIYYRVLLGCVYWLFWPALILGKILNVLISGLVALLLHALMAKIGGRPAWNFWVALGLSGAYPTFLFYSSSTFKDPLVVLLILSGLWLLSSLIARWRWWHLPLLALLGHLLVGTRSYAGLLFVYLTLLVWLVAGRAHWQIRLRVEAGLVLVFAACSQFCGSSFLYLRHLFNLLNINLLNSLRSGVYGSGESRLGILFDFSDPLQVLFYYPLSVINVMLGPFPWQVHNWVQALSLVENIPWWILFGFLSWHWKTIFRLWPRTLPLISFSFGIFAIIGLVSDNAGANLRLRLAAVMVLACLLPLVLEQRKKIPA